LKDCAAQLRGAVYDTGIVTDTTNFEMYVCAAQLRGAAHDTR